MQLQCGKSSTIKLSLSVIAWRAWRQTIAFRCVPGPQSSQTANEGSRPCATSCHCPDQPPDQRHLAKWPLNSLSVEGTRKLWPDGGWANQTLGDTVTPGETPSGCLSILRVRALHWEALAHVPHPNTAFIKLGKLRGLRGEKQELQTTEGRGLTQGREK